MVVDAHTLIPLPDELSFDAGTLLSCCLTTGAATVFNLARPEPGTSIAVFGCGAVGLGAIQAARIAGAGQIIAIDPQQHRLDIAAALGATDTLNPNEKDPIEAIIAITGSGVDHAVEAVGDPQVATAAFSVLRPGGAATVLGMMSPDADIRLPAKLLRHGRSLGGAVMGQVRTRTGHPPVCATSGQRRTQDRRARHLELSTYRGQRSDGRGVRRSWPQGDDPLLRAVSTSPR